MRPRILVVEDEGIVATDLRECLEEVGYDVVAVCRYGEDAVDKAHVLEPDLVLMDVHLAGDMDGTEAARRIRQDNDAAIVFLTAFDDASTFESAQDARPQAYLVKPYDEGTLRTAVETALRRREEGRRDTRMLNIHKEALEHLSEGVVVARNDGRVELANTAARTLLGPIESLADIPGDAAGPSNGAPERPGNDQEPWRALLGDAPCRWFLEGRPYTASATPVGDVFVVVFTAGADAQHHERQASTAMSALRSRARELI